MATDLQFRVGLTGSGELEDFLQLGPVRDAYLRDKAKRQASQVPSAGTPLCLRVTRIDPETKTVYLTSVDE